MRRILAGKIRAAFAGYQVGEAADVSRVASQSEDGEQRFFRTKHAGVEHFEFAGKADGLSFGECSSRRRGCSLMSHSG